MLVPRHGSDTAATGPRLREITIQYTLKRGVDGRPIRLGSPVTHSRAAAQVLAQVLAHEAVEVFGVLCLTIRGRVLGWHEISRGAFDGVWVHSRDVLRAALSSNAASIILAHNHPSGEADPSPDDLQLTKRLIEAGRYVGVAIVDHIIIGDLEFASMRIAPTAYSTKAYDVRPGTSVRLSMDGGIVCTKGRLAKHPVEADLIGFQHGRDDSSVHGVS